MQVGHGSKSICLRLREKSLSEAPVRMLPDSSKTFQVVFDASSFVIERALMQFDGEGRELVVSFSHDR